MTKTQIYWNNVENSPELKLFLVFLVNYITNPESLKTFYVMYLACQNYYLFIFTGDSTECINLYGW